MKKQVIVTIILLIATAFLTVVYFKNLNPPGTRTNRVMNTIPNNASLIFEFNNDKSFYDIFANNKLLSSVIGQQQLDTLTAIRQFMANPLLNSYFTGQNVFLSIHPSQLNKTNLLLTAPAAAGFETAAFDKLSKEANTGFVITPLQTGGKRGYSIFIKALKRRFYIIKSGENVFSGSFSKELIYLCAVYKPQKDKEVFISLSAQQNANSLANLYINYSELTPLFNRFFGNKNTDIFKNLRALPGLAALSLNYRSDALMFNGLTKLKLNEPATYINLFAAQQPVVNHLKDIFPSTTAYSISFAVSDTKKFNDDLTQYQNNIGLKRKRDSLFHKIKAETTISLKTDFNALLGNEFAVVTTRFFEKLGIVAIKDGSKLSQLLSHVSTMTDKNNGQLSYEKLPYFLLGDAFGIFNRPYFTVIDNYLLIANTPGELTSYADTYLNRKFISKNEQYNQFDNLLSGRSNVAFFFNFKNSQQILKRDLYPDIYEILEGQTPAWKDFYAASFQLSAADNNFYSNFCMRLNTDTITNK